MRPQNTFVMVVALGLSAIIKHPGPFFIIGGICVFLWVLRETLPGALRQHSPDRQPTEKNAPEPRAVRSEDEPRDDTFRHKQAEVNNRLALQNNEGIGEYTPDE